MKKLLQNRISESKLALPVMSVYALCVWLACGLVEHQWWAQLGCFVLSTYLMVELNNVNALIRIYSRMVSCSFLALSCAACFLFPSLRGGVETLAMIAACSLLFHTYQDRQSAGLMFYAFACIGIASMAFVHVLFFLPVVWLLTLTCLQSLTWRSFFASLLGLVAPYWFVSCWLVWQQDFTPLVIHFAALAQFGPLFDFSVLPLHEVLLVVLLAVIAVIGTVHFYRKSYNDRIRIRMLYQFFIGMDAAAFAFLCMQPQYDRGILHLLILNTSPLAAHFLALTSTRFTNALCCVLMSAIVLLTAYSLWMSFLVS